MLAEEIELTAQGKGRILRLKSTKRRMDPYRSLFIALEVVRHWQRGSSVDQAIKAVSKENNLGTETVRKSWQALQTKLKLPTDQRRARQREFEGLLITSTSVPHQSTYRPIAGHLRRANSIADQN